MKILRNINDLKKAINKFPDLGFVPTMGGLHNGHISLIKESKKKNLKTLLSIYVNPKQFNNVKDFKKYPRGINKDINILKKMRIDFLFIPNTQEIFKEKINTKFKLKKYQNVMCAKYRKGHFEGVIEVMDRLLNIIKPKIVFMGEKDFQQFFLVKSFLENKHKTYIYLCKTIRDKNKVALSTRNFFLSKKEILIASYLTKKMIKYKKDIIKDSKIIKNINDFKKKISKDLNIKIEYLEVRNEKNLTLYKKNNLFRIFVAYYIKNIRLIDNF